LTKYEDDEIASETHTHTPKRISMWTVYVQNRTVFFIEMTFFVSTSLFIFLEPILALYLVYTYDVETYVTPLFFLINSCGYLTASILIFKMKYVQSLDPKNLTIIAFLLSAGSILLLDCPYLEGNVTAKLGIMGFALFIFGIFSTFTLVPIYKVLMSSIDKYFDTYEYSK
jgi:hypothetical protein